MDSDNKSIVKIVLNKDYKLVQEKKDKDKKTNNTGVIFDFLNLFNRLASFITNKNNKNPEAINIHPPISGIE